MHSQKLETSNETNLEMKTVQNCLLFILLIAVGPYPQDVSAVGIEPTEARTDTIKLEELTTVTPNEETQNEGKVTATPLELHSTVIILQQSPASENTLNSSPTDSVYSASTAPNTTTYLETKTEEIYEAVTPEPKSIVFISQSISMSESAADLSPPTTTESISTDTESEKNTSVLESKSYTVSTTHVLVSLIASIEATPQIVEQNNNTGPTESSSTFEGSSSSVQSLPSLTASKSTHDVQQSKSHFETASYFYDLISESTEATQTLSDSENTSRIPPESSLASEITTVSSLSTRQGSAEPIPTPTETTQTLSDFENTSNISPESSLATKSAQQSSLLTNPSPAEPIPSSTKITQMPSNSQNTSSISPESSSAPERMPELELSAHPISASQTAQTPSHSENGLSIPPKSNSDTDIPSQSSLSTAESASEIIPASTEAKTESTLSYTQFSEGLTTVESTLCHSNCVTRSVLDLGTQNSITQKNYDKATKNRTTSTSQTIESGLGDADRTVATTKSEVDSKPSVFEQDTTSNASTTDGTENPETSIGPVETPLHTPEDSPIIFENIATLYPAPESEPAPSLLPMDPSVFESIPTSTETTQTPFDSDNTSSTPPELRSTPGSASESPLSSETTGPSIEDSAPIPCNETGNFPNPVNCRTYISCSGNITDLLRQEIICPDRSAFSPVLRRCARDISPCNGEPPCLFSGSIADPTTTSAYYWCAPSLLGGFHKYHIQCSIDEVFNALFGRCLLETPTYGLIKPSVDIPNDRDIAKAESKQMKKAIKAKAKEEKNRLKVAAKAKADAEKLALKQQKKQKDEDESDA